MRYKQVIEQLKRYRYILVTGPQRAGTTITANILAHELDYTYFEAGDLLDFFKTSDPRKTEISEFIKVQLGPFVAQCPYLSSAVHRWANVDGLAVVFVIRPVEDVIASQKRIGWGFEEVEKNYYYHYTSLSVFFSQEAPISFIKYHYWGSHQKPILKDKAFDLEYKSLSDHPMWVPKEERREFWSRQIRPGEPLGEKIQCGGPGIGVGVNKL